ncbi:PREDICTED: F-box protein SKIP28 [Ipomoea nil]|uniref:F-box protein SKIP28 n=1 Tax=Ipomoea nil TaxID=35883 RepID=UPI00090194B0|nr:PREDICTED: F-box protein SKIP28 [Ipomoea nil]
MVKSCAANESEEGSSEQSGPPPEAMFLILAYLPLYELLCMRQVCRSLRDAVNGDILPWLNITVEPPLHSRVSDDILMKMTAMADGRLASLALLNCFKITDDGLLRVIQKNPRINKLYIPGCTGITPEGVIKAVKLLTNSNNHRLKTLKISGIYNVTKEDLQTLCNLLGKTQNHHHHQNPKNLYHKRRDISKIRGEEEDDPSIDIDECPKCGEVRAVFDCPRESCSCRGCIICIRRCEECGVCMVGEEEEQSEAACADDLCLGCWLKLPKCSFCNRPYCHQHSNQQCRLPGYEGFLCVICNDNFVQNSSRLLSIIYMK